MISESINVDIKTPIRIHISRLTNRSMLIVIFESRDKPIRYEIKID
jgi:hypothetical protein